MLGRLLRFELRYHTRQVSFWAVLVIMFLMGLLSTIFFVEFGLSGGEKVKINGTTVVAGMINSWDTLAVFFAAVFVAGAMLRDHTHNAVEVVHATPVQTSAMVLARMIGAYVIVFALISAGTLGTFLGQFSPNVPDEALAPLRPLTFLHPMVVYSAVNTLVLVAFFTLVAGLTRSRMITLTSSLAFLAVSIIAGTLSTTDAPDWITALLDPFGGVAFGHVTEFWSVADQSERLLPLGGLIGLNRLVWLVLSAATLVSAFAMYKRGLDGRARSKRVNDAPPPSHDYAPVASRSGLLADIAATGSHAKLDLAYIFRSIPFAILIGVFAVLYITIVVVTLFFSPQKLVPTSEIMAGIGGTAMLIPLILAVSFFAGELMWRDRTHKMTEMVHATRVANWPLVMGKWIAMFALVAVLSLLPSILGFAVQLFANGPSPDFGTHLAHGVFSRLPRWTGIAVLAMFVQSFAPNRLVGMLLAFGAAMFVTVGLAFLPFAHPLMDVFGTGPGRLSEMAGYSSWISFRWFNLYALGGVIVLGTLAVWLARRGVQGGVLDRLRAAPSRINLRSVGVLAAGLAVLLFAGLTIQQSLSANDYRTRGEREDRAVAWEGVFGDYLEEPAPSITSVELFADIYPSRRDATISGRYTITNTTDAPIVHAFVDPVTRHEEDIREFAIEGARMLTEGEAFGGLSVPDAREFGAEVAEFDPPLSPGETREVRFSTYFHPPRLNDGGAIRANGTFLNNWQGNGSPQAVPSFSLFDQRVRNPDKRRKSGLEPIEPMLERDDPEGRSVNLFRSDSRLMLDATVCTDADQIGIAPGRLVGQTTEGDRHCRRYATNVPINNFYSIVSGRYGVTEGEWTSEDGRDVPIRVFHHPDHTYSVDAMIAATQHGLDVFEREFTPYKLDYFRILEVPYIGFAQAFAGTIPFAEQGFILDVGDPDDPASIDNATVTTLHELAHQWFGHELTPGMTKGFNVLSEGLTSYATLYAYEEMYGFDKALTALNATIEAMAAKKMLDREKEVPVAVAEMQNYLHYDKPDWILWGLRGYVGADAVNTALRELLVEYGDGTAPFATTAEVVAALKANTPDAYHDLIDDQWERITWWSLEFADEPSVTPTADGRYRVRVPLGLDKTINQGENNRDTSVSEIEGETLNEWVEVGFYAAPPKDGWGAWQALETVRVTEAESVLVFVLDEAPAHIALDPRRLLQERNVTDNVQAVDVTDTAMSGAN